MEENNKFLGTEKISKLLLKFAIPCILSLLISSLYNIVDQIFIGNSELGYLGNAATTIVYPVTIIAVAFTWCFGDGAAWATIIGQIVSFIISIAYLFRTKTFKLKLESFKINMKLFSNVVKLGVSTFITQMSIVVISLVCNVMLSKYGAISKYGADIPIAVIGIAMKVFTIVINIVVGIILGAQPILGFNYGAKMYDRVRETFKIVLKSTIIIGVISTLIFELCPQVVIRMFGTESDLYMEFAIMTFRIFLMFVTFTCIIKMISIFFQAVGEPIKAGIISLLRDIVCFVPLVIILPNFLGVEGTLWAAPIADLIGIICSITLVIAFFKKLGKENIEVKNVNAILKKSHPGVIVTIARQHGSQGKYIGELVAKQLNIPYYYKEMTAIAAKESGLDKEFISNLHLNSPTALNDLYLSTSPVQYAIQAQDRVIKEIANQGSCVIVGRAADYVLRDNKNLVRVFIYAPKDYRVSNIMKMYNDTKQEAIKNVEKSDKTRSNYYKTISALEWGKIDNYDLCIDSSIGKEECARIICEYVNSRK